MIVFYFLVIYFKVMECWGLLLFELYLGLLLLIRCGDVSRFSIWQLNRVMFCATLVPSNDVLYAFFLFCVLDNIIDNVFCSAQSFVVLTQWRRHKLPATLWFRWRLRCIRYRCIAGCTVKGHSFRKIIAFSYKRLVAYLKYFKWFSRSRLYFVGSVRNSVRCLCTTSPRSSKSILVFGCPVLVETVLQ